jgi:hypothetical protein
MTLRRDGEPFDAPWGRAVLSGPQMLGGAFYTEAQASPSILVQEPFKNNESPACDVSLP